MATRTTSKHFPSVIDRPAGRGSRNRTCEPAIKRRPPFIARCPTHRPAKPVRRKNPVKPGNTLRLSLSLSLFVPNNEHNGSISLGRLSFPQKRLHWMSGPKKKPIKARRLGHREGKLFSFNQPFPSRMPMFENLGQYCANSCLLIEISSIFELEYFIDMKSHVERLNQYVEPFKDCLSRSRLICRRLATWTFSLMNYSSTRAAILSISSLFCVSFPSPKTSFSISPGNGTPRTVVDVLFFLSFFFFFLNDIVLVRDADSQPNADNLRWRWTPEAEGSERLSTRRSDVRCIKEVVTFAIAGWTEPALILPFFLLRMTSFTEFYRFFCSFLTRVDPCLPSL